ncbi:MAG: hypothetical protein F6K17_18125 [Okeania sp. SIO3C4]|nr:hypothetical protein [Okeania sp. SIO3B3]NER04387.1 hypothetical protein [Okeania sp. SIO3C4]
MLKSVAVCNLREVQNFGEEFPHHIQLIKSALLKRVYDINLNYLGGPSQEDRVISCPVASVLYSGGKSKVRSQKSEVLILGLTHLQGIFFQSDPQSLRSSPERKAISNPSAGWRK